MDKKQEKRRCKFNETLAAEYPAFKPSDNNEIVICSVCNTSVSIALKGNECLLY